MTVLRPTSILGMLFTVRAQHSASSQEGLYRVLEYRKNFYDSPSQEEVVESRLGRKSRGSETKFLEMD